MQTLIGDILPAVPRYAIFMLSLCLKWSHSWLTRKQIPQVHLNLHTFQYERKCCFEWKLYPAAYFANMPSRHTSASLFLDLDIDTASNTSSLLQQPTISFSNWINWSECIIASFEGLVVRKLPKCGLQKKSLQMNLVSRFCGVPSKCENIICSSPKSKLVICCSFKKKERKKRK